MFPLFFPGPPHMVSAIWHCALRHGLHPRARRHESQYVLRISFYGTAFLILVLFYFHFICDFISFHFSSPFSLGGGGGGGGVLIIFHFLVSFTLWCVCRLFGHLAETSTGLLDLLHALLIRRLHPGQCAARGDAARAPQRPGKRRTGYYCLVCSHQKNKLKLSQKKCEKSKQLIASLNFHNEPLPCSIKMEQLRWKENKWINIDSVEQVFLFSGQHRKMIERSWNIKFEHQFLWKKRIFLDQ